MNKRLLFPMCALTFVLLSLGIVGNSTIAKEQGDEDIERIKALLDTLGDIGIKAEVEGQEGQDPVIVDGTTKFVISRTDDPNGENPYKLYYFLDHKIRRVIENISLPFEFTQTYRGLSEGNYELGFVLINASEKHGSCKVSIRVKHKRK